MTVMNARPSPASALLNGDVVQRLQQLVAGWRGAERGQPLSALHEECALAAGPGGRHLVPARVLLVAGLDATTLQAELGRLRGVGEGTRLQFRVRPIGRFDAALVPTGPVGEAPDRWLLAVEESLALRDQVALYGHALALLSLVREQRQMGQLPELDPRDGYAHLDTLGELHLLEGARSALDRRVLEAYPLLTELLRGREEPTVVADASVVELRQRLGLAGWRGEVVTAPYVFTAGRVYVSGTETRRGRRLRVDALLRAAPSLPIAAVRTARAGETLEAAARQVVEHARDRLGVPFAYLLDDAGAIHEFDSTAASDPAPAPRSALPGPDELWARWTAALGLADDRAQQVLRHPYQLGQFPRYFQEAAINRAVIAVLQARRGLRRPRVLLNMATGTGKTKVAFQIVWKLRRAREVSKVLFLTDRDYLLSQAMDNEFAPFADARHRIQGEVATARDIYFATYQAIAEDERRSGLYREYPRNFFDLVIVDECHRGSAADESNWRAILEHFRSAVQLGMTATPLHTDNVQTYAYFGEPVARYSLRNGINDGFLAPYRVRRVLLGLPAEGEHSVATAPVELPAEEGTPTVAGHDSAAASAAIVSEARSAETVATLREHTVVIARHLAEYLQRTNPMAKTIVFCVDQDHAEQMRLALREACAEQVARYADYVVRIVAETGDEGKRALGRFSLPDERTPVIATTSRLLTTGVDVPTCQNVVLARPVCSIVEFKQIIGRGTRLHEPEKRWFTIIDYAGATNLFFDPDFDGDPELVEVEPLLPRPAAPASAGDTGDGAAAPAGDGGATVEASTATAGATGPGTAGIADGQEPYTPTSASAEAGQVPASPAPGSVAAGGEATDPPAGATVPPAAPSNAPGPASQRAEQDGVTAVASLGAPGRQPTAMPTAGEPSAGAPSVTLTRGRDGRLLKVVGEVVYELGPDGKTLRPLSYRQYTVDALRELAASPGELRARWLRPEQRDEIRERLRDEGVDLPVLAAALNLPEADPLDLLLYVAFGERPLTRRERAGRVRRERADFFARHGPAARAILEAILQKYVAGEAQQVDDLELLKVPPLAERGTFLELVQPFGGGSATRAALAELQQLLYTA